MGYKMDVSSGAITCFMKGKTMRNLPCVRGVLVFLLLLGCIGFFQCPYCVATPEYSYQTDKSCSYCHEDPDGGGTLTREGEQFMDNDFELKETPGARWKTWARLVAGFLHVLTAVIWFGTIFYIHLFIKPSSFTSGLPLRERTVGWVCIFVVGLTGALLTVLKVPSVQALWTTTFGVIWLIKVGLFLVMVFIAAVATTRLNRRMREDFSAPGDDALARADGKDGRPAHVVYNGIIYDVTESKLWAEGKHMGRHFAGNDLTEAFAGAPHGPEVFERVNKVGEYSDSRSKGQGRAARTFVFMAYFILVLMLGVLFCVAYWNWGPSLFK